MLDQIRYKASWYGTQIVEAGPVVSQQQDLLNLTVSAKSLTSAVNRELDLPPIAALITNRNQNASSAICGNLRLLAVGEDVMLPDGDALAGGDTIAGETAPNEGRTKPMTTAQRQLQLAL